MDPATELRAARERVGVTQTELARRAGTSQATVSAYETGRKQPSVQTLDRLLAATGARLAVQRAPALVTPSAAQHARVARDLDDVLALAQALPTRPRATLALPPLRPRGVALPERLIALHRALARRRIPHAFGGAIALAYWTLDPRATSDIDLNVFVPAADCARAVRALPDGVARPNGTVDAIARDGQVRLWWEETPIDLFFDTVPIHADAARHRRTLPFGGTRVPVLGPIELAAFRVMFDRTRDSADLEAMISAGTLDLDALRATLGTLLPDGDPRYVRLDEAVRRAREVEPPAKGTAPILGRRSATSSPIRR